uniref:Myb-like domain-containing protein n=1 Tax=Odontella aurita TaxID=265563 RepID=A0A7S4I6N8_9STRA|mmetsp:Transcript_20706/g.60224  ORF Transcript_20706/g.60224 Transcript_20706/m.60224 type:complete len:390 (+) Transcript_20706:402-1571(+)
MTVSGAKRKLNQVPTAVTSSAEIAAARALHINLTDEGRTPVVSIAPKDVPGGAGTMSDVRRTPPLFDENERWENRTDPATPETSSSSPGSSSSEPKKAKPKFELKGRWLESEDKVLIESQRQFGNKWTQISTLLPGRSENAVKNRWKGDYIQGLLGNRPNDDKGAARKSTRPKKAVAGKKGSISPPAPSSGSPSERESARLDGADSASAPKKQKSAEHGKKSAARHRPSRSKAALAERERRRAIETERDEEAVRSLFGSQDGGAASAKPLSEREKDLVRRSYALGFTKGMKGNRIKKGNANAAAATQIPPQRLSPFVQRTADRWSDIVQWEFSSPQAEKPPPPPLLELEHTLVQHGIDLDFGLPSTEADGQYNTGIFAPVSFWGGESSY